MTYADVVRKLLEDTPHAHVICSIGAGKEIGKPLIQYQESDWQFMRRLASHLNGMLIPEATRRLPRAWFGMRQSEDAVSFDEERYTAVADDAYFLHGGAESHSRRRDFFYYDVMSYQNCSIGDKCFFRNKPLRISDKKAELVRGELIFRYKLSLGRLYALRKYDNPSFCGLSLRGTVLQTSREALKLHLDIDEKQDPATAYPYHWKPATGNMLYCMPKVGTKADLYIGDSDERLAAATNSIRTNGSAHEEFSDTDKRFFTTEHQKRLYVFPDAMGLIGSGNGGVMPLVRAADNHGITFQSHNRICIEAAGAVTMRTYAFSISAPLEITLQQGGTSFIVHNNFDGVGGQSHFNGSSPSQGGGPAGPPNKPEFDWSRQAGTVLGSYAVAGSAPEAKGLMENICGDAASAGSVMASSQTGTANISSQAAAGGQKNPGAAMAGGGQGAAIGFVPSAAGVKNISLTEKEMRRMQARKTAGFKAASIKKTRYAIRPLELRTVRFYGKPFSDLFGK